MQADISTLEALLARAEAATGPDRELDLAIGGLWPSPPFSLSIAQQRGGKPPVFEFTSSIDAALALVREKLPGWKVSITTWSSENENAPRARVFEDSVFDAEWTRAATLPLTLLAALLRALIAQAKEQGHGE